VSFSGKPDGEQTPCPEPLICQIALAAPRRVIDLSPQPAAKQKNQTRRHQREGAWLGCRGLDDLDLTLLGGEGQIWRITPYEFAGVCVSQQTGTDGLCGKMYRSQNEAVGLESGGNRIGKQRAIEEIDRPKRRYMSLYLEYPGMPPCQ